MFRPYAEAFIDAARGVGVELAVTSTRRTSTKQAALYRAYISGKSKYPAAAPGTSLHEWGLAFDVACSPASALPLLAGVWERGGFGTWGGHFKDPIHFEANAAVKKKAGYVKGAVYEPGLEQVSNPIEWLFGGSGLPGLVASLIPIPRV